MKRWLLRIAVSVVALVSAVLVAANFLLGYSPLYLWNAPSVATGIGAKLACSGRYVSGFDVEATAKDIAVYSPILTWLDYTYDDESQKVEASLLGLKTRTAQNYPGIGCALEYSGTDVRKQVSWPAMAPASSAWPKGNAVMTIQPDIQNKLDTMLATDNQQGHDTRALLLVHQGRIVAESYADGYSADTPMLGWSMTKSVNALILGHLEMQGLISVEERNLFEEWADDERSAIRVEDLLHMADGIAYDEDYDPGDVAVRMLFQEPDAAEYVLSLPKRHDPGKQFNYSSGTANLLAELVQERIPGDEIADALYIANQVFRPLGMTSVTYEMDASGLFLGSSYLYATTRDWARIGQLMLNGGKLNGYRLVSESFVERSLTPNNTENGGDYGYQWWLNKGKAETRWPDLPPSTYAAMGNREQRVLVIPEDELIIVRLGWSPKDYIDNKNFAEIRRWFQ